MPKIEQTLGDVMVRSHTLRFTSPALTDSSKVPNAWPAAPCHTDKPPAWGDRRAADLDVGVAVARRTMKLEG